MKNWSSYKLENVLNELIDYRGKTPKKSTSGIPLITAKIIKNGFIQEIQEYVSEEIYPLWMTRGFPKLGDIVLTSEAPLGEVAFIKDEKIALAQRVFTLRGNEKELHTQFLKYLLQSSLGQQKLNARATGTTVKGIKQSELRKILLELPEIDYQKAVAKIIFDYDVLIENNQRRIKILEEMAQRLYTEWFVKFKFPGHEKIKMVDSGNEFGEIPEGWEIRKLNDVVVVNPTYKLTAQQDYLHVPMECLSNNSSVINTSKSYRKTKKSGSKFVNGDVLFARITPCLQNGKTGLVSFLSKDEIGCGSTEFVVLSPKVLTSSYIYLLSRTRNFRETAILTMVGASGRQRVRSEFFSSYPTIVPDNKTLLEFENHATKFFNEAKSLNKLNQSLAKMRDLLIENLVTGKRMLKQNGKKN